MIFYRLDDDRNPQLCEPDEAFNDSNSLIRTELVSGVLVSTVFLYIDHGYGQSDKPILFETMVFSKDDSENEKCTRYSTYKQAVEGHWLQVEELGGDIKMVYDKPLPLADELFEI